MLFPLLNQVWVMLRAQDVGRAAVRQTRGSTSTKPLWHCSVRLTAQPWCGAIAVVQRHSQWSCRLLTGTALQRSQMPTKPNTTSKQKQLWRSYNVPEQRCSQPTEQQVQEVDWHQELIKSDHDAQFTAFCWCREAENSFSRYQPRDEQALS